MLKPMEASLPPHAYTYVKVRCRRTCCSRGGGSLFPPVWCKLNVENLCLMRDDGDDVGDGDGDDDDDDDGGGGGDDDL